MEQSEISDAIGNVAIHFMGWLVVVPIFGGFFALLFFAAAWAAGLEFGLGPGFVAGWAAASVLYSVELRACAKREITVVNNSLLPPISPEGWN